MCEERKQGKSRRDFRTQGEKRGDMKKLGQKSRDKATGEEL